MSENKPRPALLVQPLTHIDSLGVRNQPIRSFPNTVKGLLDIIRRKVDDEGDIEMLDADPPLVIAREKSAAEVREVGKGLWGFWGHQRREERGVE